MNQELIDGLIALLERSSLCEIDYSNGSQRVWLVRDRVLADTGHTPRPQNNEPAPPPCPTAPAGHVVRSAMTGTFYRTPGPGQPIFASPGDIVEEGHTLGLVEAMKLLNPVEADRRGRLTEVLVADGAAVAHNTPLFVIEPIES
ncbi:acetyl-CoA carboxylase biotin carboxyl carrier protein [Paraburkholderia flagellata]|uniref:acetyl-CoA carboxylase biotin carboxyl carrier protein n=1 Tax=Paraburkholderia flagellata TaxID=2883241 RepID=UPI001F3FCE61|nr:biotin/lipoyl-containing protein [Paraburkholderia flagellata]